MKVKKGDLRDAGNTLAKALKALAEAADDVEDGLPDEMESASPQLTARMAELQQKMAAADTAYQTLLSVAGVVGGDVPVTDDERLSFPAFLTQIGTAMLSTQRQLDDASLKYLHENASKPHVLPSIFRLPKLSAEMKFAIETQKGAEVNLVFFKRQSLAKEMHQQSIQFELVSAPPPPGAATATGAAIPGMQLALDPQDRKKVFEAADAAKPVDNRLPDDAAAEPNRVVILKSSPEPGYIVMYASRAGRNNVGVWLCAGDKFRAIYKFDEKIAPSEQFLRKFVSDLADLQEKVLTAGP